MVYLGLRNPVLEKPKHLHSSNPRAAQAMILELHFREGRACSFNDSLALGGLSARDGQCFNA